MKVNDFNSQKSLISARIVGKNGLSLPMYMGRNNTCFVQGVHSQIYEARVRNNTSGRLVVVMVVDGTNVIDGTQGPMAQYGTGMIIPRYSEVPFDGWRENDDVSSDFKFNIVDSETVNQQLGGRKDELGLIEFFVYQEERYIEPYMNEGTVWRGGTPKGAAPTNFGADNMRGLESYSGQPQTLGFGGDEDEKSSGSVGTGIGASKSSKVTSAPFKRATASPFDSLTVYPKSSWWLVKNGVTDEGDYDLPGARRGPFGGLRRS